MEKHRCPYSILLTVWAVTAAMKSEMQDIEEQLAVHTGPEALSSKKKVRENA